MQKLATLVSEHDPTKPLIIPFIYQFYIRSYIDPTHKLAYFITDRRHQL